MKLLSVIVLLIALAGCKSVEPLIVYEPVEVLVPVLQPLDSIPIESPPTYLVAKIDSSQTAREYVDQLNKALAAYVLWGEYITRLPLPVYFIPTHEIPIDSLVLPVPADRLRLLPTPRSN